MLDPLAEQVGIGGAVAILLVGVVMKFLPAFMSALKSQNGKNKSGDLSPSEWEGRMREIALAANEGLMKDIRSLLESRNEKMREIIRQELRQRSLERD